MSSTPCLNNPLRRRPHHATRAAESNANRAPHQESWPETFINPHDGSTMRLIPAGEFTMGSTQRDIESARKLDRDGETVPLSHESYALSHETPQFELFLPAYYMSVFTVTNEQFARFLTKLQPGRSTLEFWVYSTPHIIKPEREGQPYRVEKGFERHPGAHVTWFGAEAYCRWAGMRLPTEAEWEKAARGTDARLFPWGDEWHGEFLRWRRGERGEATAAVNVYSEGRSPYGIFQMAGNVSEWCEDWYQPRFYDEHAMGNRRPPHSGDERVLRGGSCLKKHKLEFRCAMRAASSPLSIWAAFTGIRCACDLPGTAL
jgi:formylglycine-generating enzyme required for sulfatase activity